MKKTDFTEYIITTDRFPEKFSGFRFIMLSDLHNNVYGTDLHEVNKRITKYSPDAVLIAGDMFNRNPGDNTARTIRFISALAKHYPVFYALGNHEYGLDLAGGFDRIYGRLQRAGVCFLRDETVYLEKEKVTAALSGAEIDTVFYKMRHPVMGSGLMEKHLGPAAKEMYNILLAHNPEYFHNYAEWGADLVLSGHVHGGIVRLPYVGGIISTTKRILPYYDYGLYRTAHNRKMIIGRGLGTHTVNVRINNRPEIVAVKILAKMKTKGYNKG